MLKPIVREVVHNCSDNCFANFCRKLLGNDVRLFQVHLRERLKSETANHGMIAKPTIVLPFKIETPSFARLMVEAPEELFLTDSKHIFHAILAILEYFGRFCMHLLHNIIFLINFANQ